MPSIYDIISLIGVIIALLQFMFWIHDRLIPKPNLIFNPRWYLIEITNTSKYTIYVVEVFGKNGLVADYSAKSILYEGGPDWQRKHRINLAIPVGESKDICFRFNGGYDFKMSVKRKSFFKPDKFIIILSHK